MMKFTMDAKELKTMIEKAMSTIDKKASVQDLRRVYFQIDKERILKVWGTNREHYTEIRNDNVYNVEPGVFGIDINDIKIITKMNGELTIEDVTTETQSKINIKCGKKTVSIPRYVNTDVFLPSMDETEKKIMTVKENWLLDTITKLASNVNIEANNTMLSVFHFNTDVNANRIEALDGHRLGMRTLDKQTVRERTENLSDTVKVHAMCVPVFKKIMDKKSESEINIYQDKKYIKLVGKDFIYVTKRVDGSYFMVDKILPKACEFSFIPDRKEMLEAMKYNMDLVKTSDDKKPVVLHSENGNLYSYIHTGKYESFDELSTKENEMKNDFYIGFNPRFLVDVFEVIDDEHPICKGIDPKSPMMIYGNEFTFLVLPVNLSGADINYAKKFSEMMNKDRVA